mmetsp:Transcript_21624/g.29227  ORF Transcript_21624/g.29227 Transcript_21624/m.29227 type:complete len:212 (-) Transcript_21624:202-837(-)
MLSMLDVGPSPNAAAMTSGSCEKVHLSAFLQNPLIWNLHGIGGFFFPRHPPHHHEFHMSMYHLVISIPPLPSQFIAAASMPSQLAPFMSAASQDISGSGPSQLVSMSFASMPFVGFPLIPLPITPGIPLPAPAPKPPLPAIAPPGLPVLLPNMPAAASTMLPAAAALLTQGPEPPSRTIPSAAMPESPVPPFTPPALPFAGMKPRPLRCCF